MAENLDALSATVEPVLAGLGLEFYDLEFVGTGSAQVLRVSIDREGGVDLDTITAASEAVSRLLDAPDAPAPPGRYTLEVSSPGLERKLRTPEHFRRAIGSELSVKTRVEDSVERRHGVLTGADDAGILVDFGAGPERVGYDDVIQARTVFEWGGQESGGASRDRARGGRRIGAAQ